MSDKNRYYALDEIGFVGIQDKRTKAKIRKQMAETVRYIKVMKSVATLSPGPEKKSFKVR